jgi:hypothetical protein
MFDLSHLIAEIIIIIIIIIIMKKRKEKCTHIKRKRKVFHPHALFSGRTN